MKIKKAKYKIPAITVNTWELATPITNNNAIMPTGISNKPINPKFALKIEPIFFLKAAKASSKVTDLFFSSDDIDERKVLRSDGTFDRFF